jgi:hypothetical protein
MPPRIFFFDVRIFIQINDVFLQKFSKEIFLANFGTNFAYSFMNVNSAQNF